VVIGSHLFAGAAAAFRLLELLAHEPIRRLQAIVYRRDAGS
jgi:hypothetical protein